MAIEGKYSLIVQHARLNPQAIISPQTATVQVAEEGDNILEVLDFRGVDEVGSGFEIITRVIVQRDLIDRVFNHLIDEFLRFIIKDAPSILFHMKADNDDSTATFNNRYEGVVVEADVLDYVKKADASANAYKDFYKIELKIIARIENISTSKNSYVYEDRVDSIVADDQKGGELFVHFKNSPAGTRGVMLQDVLEKVLKAQDLTSGVDYLFSFAALMSINGVQQPVASMAQSGTGVSMVSNFLLHSKNVDSDTLDVDGKVVANGLYRLTSRNRMRFQYQESDYDFLYRLCESEGISILYEIVHFTIESQTVEYSAITTDVNAKLLTKYEVTYADGTAEILTSTRTIEKPTETKPRFLLPPQSKVWRTVLIITDEDNKTSLTLSPVVKDNASGTTTVSYPLMFTNIKANKGVRYIQDLVYNNNTLLHSVVVANYSDQTDHMGSSIGHSPISATAWNEENADKTSTVMSLQSPGAASSTVGQGIQYYYGETIESQADANRLAIRRLQLHNAKSYKGVAKSHVIDMKAGAHFHLLDSSYSGADSSGGTGTVVNQTSDNGYVYKVNFKGVDKVLSKLLGGLVSDGDNFNNDFEFLPLQKHKLVFRPRIKTPKPVIKNSLQATISTEKLYEGNSYADLDVYGRYLVQFLFDRQGRTKRSYESDSGGAGNRLRKSSFFADGLDSSGFHFPLKKNTEVLVSFHAQNPDMPVIMGAMSPNKKATRLHSMASSESMSYLRTSSGNSVYFIDKPKNERLVVETDFSDAFSDNSTVEKVGNKVLNTPNYLEVGIQKSDDVTDSDLDFGVRVGTTGFNQLASASGEHNIKTTKEKYDELVEKVDTAKAEKVAKTALTDDLVVYEDANLDTLSDKDFEDNLFLFRKYQLDVNKFDDLLFPYSHFYRNQPETEEEVKGEADFLVLKAKLPEYLDASFNRVLGDEYQYRRGNDFVSSYTGAKKNIEGSTNYYFGNSIVEFHPSSGTAELKSEIESREDDESALVDVNALSGVMKKFDYSNYASELAPDNAGVTVKRYKGNYIKAVEGTYANKSMKDTHSQVHHIKHICGGDFVCETDGNLLLNTHKFEFNVTPAGSVTAVAAFPSLGVRYDTGMANAIEYKTGALLRVGLGFHVVFTNFCIQSYTSAVEFNLLGDYRFWTAGIRTQIKGFELRTMFMEDDIAIFNFGNKWNEFWAGGLLCFTSVGLTAKDEAVSIYNGVGYKKVPMLADGSSVKVMN